MPPEQLQRIQSINDDMNHAHMIAFKDYRNVGALSQINSQIQRKILRSFSQPRFERRNSLRNGGNRSPRHQGLSTAPTGRTRSNTGEKKHSPLSLEHHRTLSPLKVPVLQESQSTVHEAIQGSASTPTMSLTPMVDPIPLDENIAATSAPITPSKILFTTSKTRSARKKLITVNNIQLKEDPEKPHNTTDCHSNTDNNHNIPESNTNL